MVFSESASGEFKADLDETVRVFAQYNKRLQHWRDSGDQSAKVEAVSLLKKATASALRFPWSWGRCGAIGQRNDGADGFA